MNTDFEQTFVPIRRAAAVLGVPLAWLKREAEEGSLPAVRAGNRWFVHLEKTSAKIEQHAEGVADAD